MFNSKDVATRTTINTIVNVYETETARVRQAYTDLETASKNLTAALGKATEYSGIDTLPSRCYSDYQAVCREVLTNLKQGTWKRLISQLGIQRILSEKRNKELDTKLDDRDHLPEITVENIYQMFALLLENANHFAKESVVEVYEHLHRPGSGYKTNQRNAFEDIGPKVILGWMVETSYSRETPYRANYYQDNFLMSLDRVFHNLDGAPFLQEGYKSPLIDAINTSPDGTGETKYFKFKCYQNRNLHLEFKRADLLKVFNEIANDGTRLKSGIHF